MVKITTVILIFIAGIMIGCDKDNESTLTDGREMIIQGPELGEHPDDEMIKKWK